MDEGQCFENYKGKLILFWGWWELGQVWGQLKLHRYATIGQAKREIIAMFRGAGGLKLGSYSNGSGRFLIHHLQKFRGLSLLVSKPPTALQFYRIKYLLCVWHGARCWLEKNKIWIPNRVTINKLFTLNSLLQLKQGSSRFVFCSLNRILKALLITSCWNDRTIYHSPGPNYCFPSSFSWIASHHGWMDR